MRAYDFLQFKELRKEGSDKDLVDKFEEIYDGKKTNIKQLIFQSIMFIIDEINMCSIKDNDIDYRNKKVNNKSKLIKT